MGKNVEAVNVVFELFPELLIAVAELIVL